MCTAQDGAEGGRDCRQRDQAESSQTVSGGGGDHKAEVQLERAGGTGHRNATMLISKGRKTKMMG